MEKLLACDLGTGGVKASLFSKNGTSLAEVFLQYETFFPQEKHVEQRPMDWWNHVCKAISLLLSNSGTNANEIGCVALSGHSLVAVPIGKNKELLSEQVPIWYDTRAHDVVSDFFLDLTFEEWYTATGNGDPEETYTIFKLMWMKKHQPELFSKIYKVLGSKDFINFMLTGELCTDPSYASGFGVFHLKNWDYEDHFFKAAGISPAIFPEIRPSDEIIGHVTKEAASLCGLMEGTPVACGGVDNTCMALGSIGLLEGTAYTSLGSSSWIAVNSSEPIVDVNTRPFVFAHGKKGLYTSAVSIFSAGNSFRWVRDNLCRDLTADTDAYELMNEMAKNVPPGSNGVMFNPTLAGGSAQEPSPDLCGGFMGLTLRNTREDLVRASMEGIAMALKRTLNILMKQTTLSGEMLICGGGSKSKIWRQIFADIYQMPITKTNIDQNAASLGAAAMAANGCGIWNGYDIIQDIHQQEDYTLPNIESVKIYESLMPVFDEWIKYLAVLAQKL